MAFKIKAAIMIAALILGGAGCKGQSKNKAENKKSEISTGEQKMETINLKSSAFKDGDTIPAKYTCDDKDLSVPLEWTNVPEGTKSLALIVDDPDAPRGTWVHWVVFNIPPQIRRLPEGVSFKTDSSFAGAIEGQSDFRKTSYGGPCPPRGPAHRYFFKIYALDSMLDLTSRATKADLEKAMKGHILASGLIIGKYTRRQ